MSSISKCPVQQYEVTILRRRLNRETIFNTEQDKYIETSGRKSKTKKESNESKEQAAQLASDTFKQNSKKPFVLLREAFAMIGGSDEKIKARALGAWSMVHGMAALMIEGHIRVPEGVSLKQFLSAASDLSDKG